MRRFHFRLENVLEWRRVQLELEETKLERLFGERARIDATAERLSFEASQAADAIIRRKNLEAQELGALEAHRRYVARELERLARERAACEQRIAAQRREVQKADRDLRLLENLKQRRLQEWRAEASREEEALASELFLAQWCRDR